MSRSAKTSLHSVQAYADSKGPDQPHLCRLIRTFPVTGTLTESFDTTECMNGEQRPGRYFENAQVDLNLRILCMFEGTFLLNPFMPSGLFYLNSLD